MRRGFVIGGGVTGLACGDALAESGWRVTVLEASPQAGGLAASVSVGGYRFDMGPHKLWSPMSEPMERLRGLFPDGTELRAIPKVSQIHVHGKSLAYPLALSELLAAVPRRRALSFGASFLASRLSRPEPNGSYASFMRRQFGRALYDDVFGPAARKVFGEDERLSRRLGEARFKGKDLTTFVKQALRPGDARIDAVSFLYPKQGTGEVPERLRRRIVSRGGVVRTGAAVHRIACSGGRVVRIHLPGEEIDVGPEDAVVYTVALRDAPRILDLSSRAHTSAEALRHRMLLLVCLRLSRPAVMASQWVFYPTADVSFNRLSEPRNFSPEMAPEGKTSLIAEITAAEGAPPGFDGEAAGRAVDDLVRLGLVRREYIEAVSTIRLDLGYPVWLVGFEDAREALLSEMDGIGNLYPLGRQGLYQYVGILDCIDMALRAARHIHAREPRSHWTELRSALEGYPVVD